jgi:hypothetical protein
MVAQIQAVPLVDRFNETGATVDMENLFLEFPAAGSSV